MTFSRALPANPTTDSALATSAPGPGLRAKLAESFAFRRVGGVYVLAVIIAYFWITVSTFGTIATFKQILNGNAIAAMAALALVIPLAAGIFDLSVAYTMSLIGVLCAYLVATENWPLWAAVIVSLLAALGIGLVNAFVVVVMKIDSFIGTLATGALIQTLITLITNSNSISSERLSHGFSRIAQDSVGGFTLPILYAVVIALVMWHVQERTATGRRLYAIGFNRDAARLAGIRTERFRFVSLLVSATIGGGAGIVLASSIGSGDPSAGTPYLLSAFAASFLGATQFKEGRFNAGGTLVAIALLGTGTVGLGLAGAPLWSQTLFTGIVLIAALAVTSRKRRTSRIGAGPRAPRSVRPTRGNEVA